MTANCHNLFTHRRHELLIIGGSNSIMSNGYASILRSIYGKSSNYSFGSSSYTLLALQADRVRQHRNSIVILDLAVTDQYTNQSLPIDFALHERVFEAFLIDCADNGHLPVILIMPSAWQRASVGPIRELYRRYARQFDVPIFDGFSFIERLYTLRPDLAHYGYEAGTHLNPYLARILGRCLHAALDRFQIEATARTVTATKAWRCESHLIENNSFYPNALERYSYLTHRTVIDLRAGDKLEIDLPKQAEVIGYAVDAVLTWALMGVEGEVFLIKDVRNGWFEGYNHLILTAWMFRQALRPRDGRLQIHCLDPDDVGPDANIEPCEIPFRNHSAHTGARLAINGVIYTVPRGTAARIAYNGNLDLLDSLANDEIKAGAAAELEPPDFAPPEVSRAGTDGISVIIPKGHSYRIGRDGHLVPIPPGHSFRQGSDGRMIAIPPGFSFREGPDGRMIAIPPDFRAHVGRGGRLKITPKVS